MASDSLGDGDYVLDTSALLTIHQDEPGAKDVENVLIVSGANRRVWISFISLMEFSYIIQQQDGVEKSRQSYTKLKQLPILVVESDENLGLMAASLKAVHQLSVADAWIAATAQRLNATLMHKDPEFEELSKVIKLYSLPFKAKSSS